MPRAGTPGRTSPGTPGAGRLSIAASVPVPQAASLRLRWHFAAAAGGEPSSGLPCRPRPFFTCRPLRPAARLKLGRLLIFESCELFVGPGRHCVQRVSFGGLRRREEKAALTMPLMSVLRWTFLVLPPDPRHSRVPWFQLKGLPSCFLEDRSGRSTFSVFTTRERLRFTPSFEGWCVDRQLLVPAFPVPVEDVTPLPRPLAVVLWPLMVPVLL